MQIPHLTSSDNMFGWNRSNMGTDISILGAKCIKVATPQKEHFSHLAFQGAMSNMGFAHGRHIFAFMWPRNQRYIKGAHLTVGIGYNSVDLESEYIIPTVGGNRKSMAFNIIQNSLVFNNHRVDTYPRGKSSDFSVPTLFYMYLDLEQGKLSFGSEKEFWGIAFEFGNMRKNRNHPFHAMVGIRGVNGKIMMFYKGCGEFCPLCGYYSHL